MTKQPRSGEEAHGRGPASFEGGAVTAGGQIGGSRVIGPIARVDRGPGEPDGEHRLADTGRPDQAARWWRPRRTAVCRARSSASCRPMAGRRSRSRRASTARAGRRSVRGRLGVGSRSRSPRPRAGGRGTRSDRVAPCAHVRARPAVPRPPRRGADRPDVPGAVDRSRTRSPPRHDLA